MVSVTDQVQCGRPVGNMAEYVDGSEKAPLQESKRSSSAAAAAGAKRPTQKPDWTRFGLSGGDGDPPRRRPGGGGDSSTLTGNDEDAGEVNEIYAEHEVCPSV